MDGVQRQLTIMLADQAGKDGAAFVDSYIDSLGRDACQPAAATFPRVQPFLVASTQIPATEPAKGPRWTTTRAPVLLLIALVTNLVIGGAFQTRWCCNWTKIN